MGLERLDPLKITPKKFWEKFKRTDQIIVPKNLKNWLIGQDDVMHRLDLGLEQFERKLLDFQGARKRGESISPIMRERPGPYFLLIGIPGCGKSLIGKIIRETLTERYRKKGIEIQDVLCLENPVDKYRPRILLTKAGLGLRYVQWRVRQAVHKLKRKLNFLRNFLVGILGGFGIFLILWVIGMFLDKLLWFISILGQELTLHDALGNPYTVIVDYPLALKVASDIFLAYGGMFAMGAQLIMVSVFAYWILSSLASGGMGSLMTGAMSKEYVKSPNLIVNNAEGKAPFVMNLSINPSEIFGDIAWDPLQAPGLGQPVNKRVTAGDIHKAHGGVFFLDEFKTMSQQVATRLLTAMEDGEYPIGYQGSGLAGGGTAALNVKTDPVPCTFYLIAAGNNDILTDPNSVLNRLPQFRNRFQYGGIIYMNDDVEDTPYTRMKMAQFVADEATRFNLLPFSKEAVLEVIEFLKRRSQMKGRLSLALRFALGLLQDSSNLAINKNDEIITAEHVKEALILRKPVEVQKMEKQIEKRKALKKIKTEGVEIGRVNGLVVWGKGFEEGCGDVNAIKVIMEKCEPGQGDLLLTGVRKDEVQNTMIEQSLAMVRSLIKKTRGIDIKKDYYTHVDFVQSTNADGPSAGITMLLAIESCLDDIPIRQDSAVTGKVELVEDSSDIVISAIGGVFEKVEGAERLGLKQVIIPSDNWKTHPISDRQKDYEIRILHGATDKEYLELLRGEK